MSSDGCETCAFVLLKCTSAWLLVHVYPSLSSFPAPAPRLFEGNNEFFFWGVSVTAAQERQNRQMRKTGKRQEGVVSVCCECVLEKLAQSKPCCS